MNSAKNTTKKMNFQRSQKWACQNEYVKMSLYQRDLLVILLLVDISFHFRRLSEICKVVLNHQTKLWSKVKKSGKIGEDQETLISVSV